MKKGMAIIALALAIMIAGCAKKEEAATTKPAEQTIPVTVTNVVTQVLSVTQESVGWIESKTAPFVSAEIAGRVTKILVDAGQAVNAGQVMAELDKEDLLISRRGAQSEIKRITALLSNEQVTVKRNRELVKDNFVSQTALDTSETQLAAYKEQLEGAKAQLDAIENKLKKTTIVAPVSGHVEQRLVSLGSFIDMGKPVFQVSTSGKLRAHLPFPETKSAVLKIGLPVKLASPAAPDRTVESAITEISPMIGSANRSVDVIVEFENPGDFAPGASVTGVITMEKIPSAITVPALSVVRRPAGSVVYVANNGVAEQRIVTTGKRQDDFVQIVSGLNEGETVVVDGAAFLTDKIKINIKGDGK